jgi:hypothetical protein
MVVDNWNPADDTWHPDAEVLFEEQVTTTTEVQLLVQGENIEEENIEEGNVEEENVEDEAVEDVHLSTKESLTELLLAIVKRQRFVSTCISFNFNFNLMFNHGIVRC